MTGSAFDTYSDLLFKMVGILNVDNIYKLQIGNYIHLYNIFNGCGTKIKFLCNSEATLGQRECVMKPSKRKDFKGAILKI